MPLKTHPFLLSTDWIFQGEMDFEYQEYKLLAYFQKMGKKLDNMEMYPMFSEISLHYANILSLKNKNSLITTEKIFKSCYDEISPDDLIFTPAPNMDKETMLEYHKIIRYSAEKFEIFYNVLKSVWTNIYDNIIIVPKTIYSNNSRSGIFYIEYMNNLFVWEFKVSSNNSQIETKLIHTEFNEKKTVDEIIKKSVNEKSIEDLQIYEVICNNFVPLEESLVPITRRKILYLYTQNKSNLKLLTS